MVPVHVLRERLRTGVDDVYSSAGVIAARLAPPHCLDARMSSVHGLLRRNIWGCFPVYA